MKVSELGEFALIDRLAELLAGRGDTGPVERLAVGIGDDAAVWRNVSPATVATTDTLVADVHFQPGKTPWRATGWKAVAVNVSDIAAMGCRPDFALITLGLPADADTEDLDELYAGVSEAAAAFGVAVAGGDIVRAPVAFISVALTGVAELEDGAPRVLLRSAARAGDAVAVTGTLGGAAGGLRMLLRDAVDSDDALRLIERHVRPQPRVEAGVAALDAGLRCAIDISDGLLRDLGHICQESRLGASIRADLIPIDPALTPAFGTAEALALAASGGEDYELLLAGDEGRIREVQQRTDVPLTVIGAMTEDEARKVRLATATGEAIELPSEGWDHLGA